MFLILFAFFAGIVTILSPCILPILPVVLSGSLSGGKQRPLGIIVGFVTSFTFFTLFLATLVNQLHISADILRTFAIVLIFLFGISLLLPITQLLLERIFQIFANLTPQSNQNSGFLGGILVGISLGVVWTPCVGPILASVITLAVASTITGTTFLITLAYSLGTAIPMFFIALGGRKLLQKVPGLLEYTAQIQQIFGVVMVATAIAMFFNIDRQFQTFILQKFPQYGTGLTQIEQTQSVQSELSKLRPDQQLQNLKEDFLSAVGPTASDFTGGTHWLNSPPLSLKKDLKGKVVLVDFWTYTCINCIRTLPYIRQWYDTYKDKDFVVVGVHTPEFQFEKETANVEKALKDLQITYPVVQDNNYAIWNAYQNQFWPAHYLIDKNGKIRYTHFGEGKYVETENAIRELLDEAPLNTREKDSSVQRLTPETYLGYARADAYTQQNNVQPEKEIEFKTVSPIEDDAVGLTGKWLIGKESITSKSNGSSLKINFIAHQVYVVLRNTSVQSAVVTVKLDGQSLPQKYFTKDMNAQGQITVTDSKKYDMVDLKDEYGRHELEIIFPAGVEVYAFTFG